MSSRKEELRSFTRTHTHTLNVAICLSLSLCVCMNLMLQGKANKPNVRTLNTLLRGCLWSAATISEDGNSVVGGVVTAERAWEAFKNLNNSDHSMVDVSSYEYTVTLLCHALRTGDARQRIQEMKERFGTHGSAVDDKNPNDDQSLTEALAVVHLALGRAHTILNESEESIRECNNAVEFAKLSKNALKSETSFSRKQYTCPDRLSLLCDIPDYTNRIALTLQCFSLFLGKRGWKESNEDEDRRSQSNSVYREHRLSEIESEAKTIIDICSECVQDGNLAARGLARRMTTRLVYLSGGGSSENQSTTDNINSTGTSSSSSQRCLTNSLFFSFGLSTIAGKLGVLVGDRTTPLKQKESNRILGAVGLQGGILNENDTLNTHRIFSAGIGDAKNQKKRKKKTRRVEVELGAGFGDWIVRKAIENPTIDYMAVELRADRVAQIFARTAIISSSSPVNNLCVIGGDSGRFLSHHLAPGSIDSVYINHPEPPTQTFGADSDTLHSIMQGGEEPAHMLHSSVLIAAISSLKVSGKSQLIIVTDNKWYARLICVTLHKVKTLHPGRIETVNLTKEDNSFQKIEVPEIEGSLSVIYEGQPNETTGYPAAREGAGESYFDRLWRAGAGTHAERKARFVFLERMVDSKNTK